MGLALDELENTKDRVVKVNGVDIVVDSYVESYIRDIPALTIDYIDSPRGAGFVLDTGYSCESSCAEC